MDVFILLVIIVLAFFGLLILTMLFIAFFYARMITRAHSQPIIRTPKDYDMNYEDVEFRSTDGLLIKGWFIPGTSGKTLVISHAFTFNRHGFEPKNQGVFKTFKTRVDMMTTIEVLHNEGYSILLFDFRNHGESEKGITGLGLNEWQDALGALNYLKTRPDVDMNRVGMIGFCMASASFMAMSSRTSIPKCLAAIQPVSIDLSTKRYLKKFMGSFLASITISLASEISKMLGGYSFKDMSPLNSAKSIQMPVLYIQSQNDPWGTVEDVKSFYNATPTEKEFWVIKDLPERFDTYNYVGEHPKRIVDFLDKHILMIP